MYMKSDSDVTLFAKTLKNECDQEFRGVQEFVKEQLAQAFKTSIRERNSTRSEAEIKELAENYKGQGVGLEKWMWSRTIAKLYSADEK